MGNIITPVLPHDLPENWNDTQYVSPGGTEVGLTEKHGYNYLMKQVNNSQKAINELDAEMENIDTTLQNKAPAGYGLGTIGASINSGKDLNDIWKCGFYSWGTGVSNAPFSYGLMVVISPSAYAAGRVQIAYDRVNKTIAIRWLNTTWSPWEYQNPPMVVGKEYRTTERYMGKPVYTILVDFGSFPNSTQKDVEIPEKGFYAYDVCIDFTKSVVTYPNDNRTSILPFKDGMTEISVNNACVRVKTRSDLSRASGYICVKYTKSTD